jgi:flagellar M-ring protein FliF
MDSQSFLDRLKQLTASFTPSQLVTLGVTFLLVIGVVVGSALWLNTPTYRLLLSDADPATMAQVVTKLKEAGVPYQIDEGGGGVRVPASRVDELRLEILSKGLPDSGRPGWEILDQNRLGVTDFVEKANYRRALEGEIARTVASISEVASARVHIAIGKETPFGPSRPTTASVVVKLKGDRPLPAASINGITNLVAYSVEGLRPESVVVVDHLGRPLAKPNSEDDDPAGAANLERQQRMERELAGQVTTLLEPVVGDGRVKVSVALRLNSGSTEETQDLWDPNATALRSRETSTETSSSGTAAATSSVAGAIVPGTAGARANAPPPTPPPTAAAAGAAGGPGAPAAQPVTGPSSARNSERVNQEISRTTRRTVQPAGTIARVSVAVVIDHKDEVKTETGTTSVTRVPRTTEELQQIQEIVSSAVGFDQSRGDTVTVKNISFQEPIAEEVQAPSALVRYGPQIEEGVRVGGLLLVVLLTFLFVVKPVMRRVTAPATAQVALVGADGGVMASLGPRVRTVAELESEIAASLDAQAQQVSPENLRLPVLTKRITESSQKEPEHVAKVLRSWMNETAR